MPPVAPATPTTPTTSAIPLGPGYKNLHCCVLSIDATPGVKANVLFKWGDGPRPVLRLVLEIEWATLRNKWGDKLETHIPEHIYTVVCNIIKSKAAIEGTIWSNRELGDFGIVEERCVPLLRGEDLILFEEVGKEFMCSLA